MYKNKKEIKPSFKAFNENLRGGKLGKLLLLSGEEQYLVKWAVETLMKKYVNKATWSMDFQILDEDNSSCDQIICAAETFSMFSERRVVWVRNFKPLIKASVVGYSGDELNNLIEYIKESNEKTILIFSCEEEPLEKGDLVKTLAEYGQWYDFAKISRGEFSSFAKKRLSKVGIDIGNSALAMLIDFTGYFNKESDYRLYTFENDIKKIIAHSDGVRIKEEDIIKSVESDMDTFIFNMLDGISNNQKDVAFKVLNNMLHSGGKIYEIIGAIVSQFELILEIKQLRSDGMDVSAMHKKIGGSEWRMKKLIPFANKYPEDKLKSILSDIYEVDRNIKTGLLNEQLALELFIAKI